VTNMMGQIGPILMLKVVTAGSVKLGCRMKTPMIPKKSPRKTM